MYYGINKNGTRTYIDCSAEGEEYFCPVCEGLLIRKTQGRKVAHHFAHKRNPCDSWEHSGMSLWHKAMQDKFSEECREVCLINENGEKHIADIFIKRDNKPNIVFEFQHSPIEQREFNRRNRFYTYAGANTNKQGEIQENWVIWVFDMTKKNMYIDLYDDDTNSDVEPEKDYQCTKILEEYQKSYNYKRLFWSNHPAIPKFLDEDRNRLSYKSGLHINENVRPKRNVHVEIHWKRPNNIFQGIDNNVCVFFDVVQRKYAYIEYTYEDKYGREHEQETYMFLGEELQNDSVKDEMHQFFVNMTPDFPMRCAYNLRNAYSEFTGKCYPIDDFWERVDRLLPK